MIRLLQRALAAALSAALILVSPGFETYAVAGKTVSAPVAGAAAPRVVPSISINAIGGLNAPSIGTISLPDVKIGNLPSIPSANAQAAGQAASLPILSAQGRKMTSAQAAQNAASSARVDAAAPVSLNKPAGNTATASHMAALNAVEQAVAPSVQQSIQNGSVSAAFGAGRSIESTLTGERVRSGDDATPVANANSFGGDGFFFAKPAGDSIREANEALTPESDGGSNVPTPPSGNDGGGGDNNNNDDQGPAPRIPFAAKVVSAAIALAPIALIGWPLIAAGSTILGSLVVAGSLGYAAFPFIATSKSKLTKALPGVAVSALGVAGIVAGVASGALGFAAIGALAGLGGWGLMRWANKSEKYPDETEILLTMLGMLGAIAAVGLGAAPVAGLAAILKIAAIPATIPLLMHLPGWVGDTITNTVKALYRSAEQTYRVATSLRRDTNLRRRLTDYSEAAIEKSSWNVLWLGLFIWLPILVSETVQFVLGLAVGLTVGAIRTPQVALWTLVHHFAKDSSLNKRLAYGARATANVTAKAGYFNAMEKPFLDWANSESRIKRGIGALGIRLAQIAWLVSVPFAALGATLGAWAFAGAEAQKPYDYALHSPDYLKMPRDTMGDNVPIPDKSKAAPGSLPARALASLIGLGAFALLTLPIAFGGGLLGGLIGLTGLSIAAMPLLGRRLGKFPGTLLAATGVFTVWGAVQYMLVGLPTGPILAIGVVALLAGFGMRNLVKKLADENEKKKIDTDDWQYSLGYVGALGTMASLSVALLMLGFGGGNLLAQSIYWGGMVSSLALLAHLPSYLWKGLADGFGALFKSVSHAWDGIGVWWDKTRFHRNYMNWLSDIIGRYSVFVAPALLPLFLPFVVLYVAQIASSLALGLALGVYHFPGVYVWGAAYHANPKSKLTRFLAGANTAVYEQLLGSRKTLEKWVEKLEPAANSTAEGSRRPTLKAFAAMLGVAALTTVWLARVALAIALSPLLWVYAIVKGFQRMGKPSSENAYEDGPDNIF